MSKHILNKTLNIVNSVCVVLALSFFAASPILAAITPQVQTNSATNTQNASAVLNGNLSDLGGYYTAYIWFEWGTTTSYGNETSHLAQNYSGNFSQQIYNLSPNTTYHFRAIAQNNYGIVYGQDMTFTTSGGGQQTYNVSIADFYFNPSNIQVNAGDTVVWTNNGQMSHTATSDSGNELNSGTLNSGATYSHTFLTAGTFPYHCSFHSSMHGTVTVVSSSQNNFSVQTNAATNVYNNSATLNGYATNSVLYGTTYVWFQWGTTTSYGNETQHQSITNSGPFSQNIANLSANTAYHFRAVAQNVSGAIVYGSDTAFYTTGSGYSGTLSVNKTVINFSAGNFNWSNSMNANPSDVLGFVITLRAGSQDIHNVFVKDALPANLIYQNNLTATGSSNYTGNDITSGITINTIGAGQIVIIGYQAQVAPAQNFNYGTSTLNNSATITSNEAGSQTSSAAVNITKSLVEGATNVSTGITNNFLADSFLLPLLLILAGLWFYFSGNAYRFADWLRTKI